MKKACLIEAAKIDIGKNNSHVLRVEINIEKTLKDAGLRFLQHKWHSRTSMLYSRSYRGSLLRILSMVMQCIAEVFFISH